MLGQSTNTAASSLRVSTAVAKAQAPHAWFLVEVITTQRLTLIYCVWIALLVLSAFMTAFVSEQFDCYEFCGFASQSCSIFGVESRMDCINMSSSIWMGSGPPLPFSSILRQQSRILISQPGVLNETATEKLGITLDEDSFLHTRFHSVLPNGSYASSVDLGYASTPDFIRLELPRSYRMDPDSTAMALELLSVPTFSNATHRGQPIDFFSDDAPTIKSGLSVVFLTLKPRWAVAEVAVRYFCLLSNLLNVSILAKNYVVTGPLHFSELLTSLHQFALEFAAVVAYHWITCLLCDPLAIFTLLFPSRPVLRYWSDHFVYATFIGVVMSAMMYLCITLPLLAAVRRRWVQVLLICFSASFGVTFFILDAIAASEDTFLSSVVSPNRDEHASDTEQGIAIAGYTLMILWGLTVFTLWVLYKDCIVYNKGRRLYYGRTRLRILALRLVASCASLYALYWVVVYIPIQQRYSGFVPANQRTGIQDVIAATFISILNCSLWSIWRYDADRAPPRAEQMHHTFIFTAEEDDPFSASSFVFVPPSGGPPAATNGSSLVGDDTADRNEPFAAPPGGEREIAVAPSGGAEVGGAGGPDDEELTATSDPYWQLFRWKSSNFHFVEHYAHSGYYFLTEAQAMRFRYRHRMIRNRRGFFCFETANACLALSNEVYYDAPLESCRQSIAAKQPAILGCLYGWCGCCMADPAAQQDDLNRSNKLRRSRRGHDDGGDGKETAGFGITCGPIGASQLDAAIDDEPEGLCDERTLDVAKHGFRLEGSLDIADVQVIVTSMRGEDAGKIDKHPFGDEETVPVVRLGDDDDAHHPHRHNEQPSGTATPVAVELADDDGRDDPVREGRMTHICVTFRGTANSTNAFADANIGRTVFQAMADRRAKYARVHAGFEACWSQLESGVFALLDEGLETFAARIGSPAHRVPVVFAGHSLGGALAILAAYAHVRRVNSAQRAANVSVYTFGMPRVGNNVFAHEYNLAVPETYRVVNENDTVACVNHCTRVHVGRTVVVDRDGNFMVEPNAVEQWHNPLSGAGFSIKNHFLYRYGFSMDRIFAAHGYARQLKSFLSLEPEPESPKAPPVHEDGSYVVVDTEAAAADGGIRQPSPTRETDEIDGGVGDDEEPNAANGGQTHAVARRVGADGGGAGLVETEDDMQP